MLPNKKNRQASRHFRTSQAGVAALEFAILAVVFFTFVFGIIEVARLAYVFNTLQESTRRAAAAAVNINPSDPAAIAKVKQDAVFRTSPGELALGQPVTDRSIRIDYLALLRAPDGSMSMAEVPQSAWPSGPCANRQTCMANPNDANCIRFVRVRICDPNNTDACDAVQSRPIAGLLDFAINLPKATTIVPAESLGYRPGMAP
jgi:hypothetical protein